jgi:hypothetical protein
MTILSILNNSRGFKLGGDHSDILLSAGEVELMLKELSPQS